MGQNGDDKPSLIIFDLNNVGAKPLTLIPKLKIKLKKATNIIGFVSHVQGELKMKAQEAGCDMVLPRSAFSQNLPQLLRRHAVRRRVAGARSAELGSDLSTLASVSVFDRGTRCWPLRFVICHPEESAYRVPKGTTLAAP